MLLLKKVWYNKNFQDCKKAAGFIYLYIIIRNYYYTNWQKSMIKTMVTIKESTQN